ncbi:CAP domain-containing protein [Streptomyces sp. V4-01]|uniref:CAP domain-containing protein n=1 Tax=Actinacidiphila polyblastidii TaxID=3110430 RepID=A0ABU7PH51_9ACTN|nr:CAP domain-containing protein [Streptomyces sp. V4-01]
MSSHRRTSRSAGHRAPRTPRIRMALSGAAALAVVGGGTAFACMGHPEHHQAQTAWGHAAQPAGWRPGGHSSAHPTPPHHTPAHHTPPPTAAPSAGSSRPTPRPTATRPAPTTPAPTPTAKPTPTPAPTATTAGSAVQQVLDLINTARAQQGLPAYKLLAGLTASATQHNQVMEAGCGLSHQCPGEDPFGDRETANGVHWSSAGENIGVGGPVADTPQAIATMAVGLTQGMLDEKAPNDGHRRNILSSGFVYVGIAVHRDGSGSVWLTQDFASLQ